MNAETYDLLVSLLGSALAGLVFFLAGVLLGFLLWGGFRRKARLARSLGESRETGAQRRPGGP